jgi:energy-converting hydrogenase Eha subunit B
MKPTKKIIIQFVIIEVCSLLFGILFGMEGAQYSGEFMVTKFMGNDGWQAGALFYGLIGISLGAYLGAILSIKILHIKGSFFAGFLISLLVYGLNIMPYDHGIPVLGTIQLYLLPAIGALIGINWYLIRPKLNIT